MKANRVSISRFAGRWLVKFHPDRQESRPYSPSHASMTRLMDICNGDTVSIHHYITFDRIGLIIHRNITYITVDDSKSRMWKANRRRDEYPIGL